LEIAALGYQCQGNEFSAFMAMAANFVLNGVTEPRAYTVYPWLDRVCNVVRVGDVMAPAQVPADCPLPRPLQGDTLASVCHACI
jgi:carnosine N-methyltransferase